MRRTKTQWDIIVAQYYSSGLEQHDFCKKHSINIHTFRDRLCKIKKYTNNAAIQNIDIKSGESISKLQEEIAWVKITDPINSKLSAHVIDTQKNQNKGIQVIVGNFIIIVDASFEEVAFCKVCKALNNLC